MPSTHRTTDSTNRSRHRRLTNTPQSTLHPLRLQQHSNRLARRDIELRVRVPNHAQERVNIDSMRGHRHDQTPIILENVIQKPLHPQRLGTRRLNRVAFKQSICFAESLFKLVIRKPLCDPRPRMAPRAGTLVYRFTEGLCVSLASPRQPKRRTNLFHRRRKSASAIPSRKRSKGQVCRRECPCHGTDVERLRKGELFCWRHVSPEDV